MISKATMNKIKELEDMALWLRDEVMDEDNWELNAVANGEIICRKLKKLGLLEVKDGYYVRANVTPTERTGEWIRRKDGGATCSRCGVMLGKGQWTNYDGIPYYYCPNCGAKMGGDTE